MDGSTFTLEAETGAPVTHYNIVPRATVRDMVRRRQHALDSFERAFTALGSASAAQADAFGALNAITHKTSESSAYLYLTKEEDRHFVAKLQLPERADFLQVARKVVDRRMWAHLIDLTEFEKIMDKQAKDQLRQELMDNVPEATEENIFATLQQFAFDAGNIFRRGIANCFSKLDRRFRSHDGWKVGGRIILSRMFNESGWLSYHSNQGDTLYDVDRTLHVLDGKGNPTDATGILNRVKAERKAWGKQQSEHETEYLKVRCYENGNAHLWFKRKDLVEKVNKLLGEYYGAPIPEERAAQDDPLTKTKTALAKNYGFFPTPEGPANDLIKHARLYRPEGSPPLTVLEPSAGTGNLASLAAKDGAIVDCVEYQPELAERLRASGRYRNVLTCDFLALRPAGKIQMYDRVIMNPPFDRERDIDHVLHALKFLKPDGLLVAIISAGTEFRETRKSIAFRDLMKQMRASWRDLPAGSFASVGTYVNTVYLRVWNDRRTQSHWGW